MDIYLACTVRGDRGGLASARALADLLEQHGHTVLTRHLLADDVEAAESTLTERDVFERDLRWLNAADLLIAEASGSSFGVGFEVGYVLGRADRTGQRVLLLYDSTRRANVSRLIAGNAHSACTTYPYRDGADLMQFVSLYLAPVAETRKDTETRNNSDGFRPRNLPCFSVLFRGFSLRVLQRVRRGARCGRASPSVPLPLRRSR